MSQRHYENNDHPTSHSSSGSGVKPFTPVSDCTLPLIFRSIVPKAFILLLLFYTVTAFNLQKAFSQDKSDCQASRVVDLSGAPDEVLELPPLFPGEECCGMPDYYDCFEVKMILHPNAKAFEIEFIDDIGELYYVVNCTGGSQPVPSNRRLRVCVDNPLLPISVTFCRPNSLPYNLKVTSLVSGVDIEFDPLPLLCTNSAPLGLDQALPVGGQYYINNETSTSTSFNPAVYGIGEHTVTYKYTDPQNGCKGIATQNITVSALPELTCTYHEVCLNHGPIALQDLQHQLPTGGKFIFNTKEIVEFDPQLAGTGTHTIQYIYTHPDTGCTNSCSFTIKVNALPIANQRQETICDTEGAGIIHNINLRNYQNWINNQHNHTFEFYTDEALSDLIINPENVSVTASQSFWVKVTHTISGCYNIGRLTFNFQVMVLNHHSVEYCDASNDNSMELYYLNLTIFNNFIYPTGTGRVYKWYTDAELTNVAPFPVPVVKGPTEIFYIEVSHGACTASSTLTVGVKPRPELDCSNLDFTVCQGSPSIVLKDYFSHLPESGVYRLNGTSARTTFNPTTAGVHYFTYTYNDPSTGCSRVCGFDITVVELPTANNRTPLLCDKDGTGVVHNVDLTTYESSVSGQPGNVYQYFENAELTLPVATPTNVSITNGKRFWVKVSNPSGCSRVATLTFSLQTLVVSDKTFSLCDMSGGSNIYYDLNLTHYNNLVYPTASGIVYQWFADAGLTIPISGIVSATPQNTDYWVRVTRGPCTEVAKVTFLVNPLPAIGCPTEELAFCRNDAPLDLTTLSVTPAGGVFSGTGVSGGTTFNPASAVTGNNTITYTFTDTTTGCFSTCTFNIGVHDVPTINASNQDIDFCHPSGQVAVDLLSYRHEINSHSGVSFSFYKDPGLTIPALPANNYSVQDGDIVYVKVSNINCFERATLTFTVKNGLNLSPQTTTLCDQTLDDQKKVFDINLNEFNNLFYPVAPEVSYFWFSDPSYSNAILTDVPMINTGERYYLRATYDQCMEEADLTFNILPLPELSCNIAVEDLCENTAPFDLENIAPQPGGFFEGIGVTENFFDPGVAGPGTHALSYYYTDAFSCTARCDFTITVKEVTPAICPDTLYFCSAGGPRLLNQALPPGGVYDGPGVYPDGGQFYFDTDLVGVGVYHIDYIYFENGCQDTCTVVINVLELIPFSCDGDQVTCENSGVMILNDLCPQPGTFSGSGVTFNSLTEVYEFNPTVAGVGTHLITHVYTNPLSLIQYTCLFNITVQAAPTVSCNIANKAFCPEYGPITLADHFPSSPAGGTYYYNGTPVETFIPTQSGVFEIVYAYTHPDTNCENTCSFTITINPQPDANDIIVELCHPSGQLIVNLNDFKEFIFGQAGASFEYFSDPLHTHPLTNPTNYTAQEGNIVYVKVTNSHGCTGYATMGFAFTTIDLTEQSIELCDQSSDHSQKAHNVNLQDFNSVFYPENPGLTFHWYTHEAMLPHQEVLIAGTIHNGDIYYLKVALPDCEFSTRATFNIIPLPPVNCSPVNVSMHETELLLLPFATPEGGSFAGPWISGNVFNIQAAGPGYHDITYTYTDGNGCTASCSTQIFVFNPDDFYCPTDFSVCLNEGLIELDMASPPEGVYTGTGVSFDGNRYFFNPLVAGAGIHTITFSIALHNHTHTCTFLITVKSLPALNCPTDIILCRGDGNVTLNELTHYPEGGIFSGQYVSEFNGVYTFNTDLAASGTYIIEYTYTHPSTHCTNTCSFTIRVNELPVISWSGNMSFCSNDVVEKLLLATPAGGVYSGNWVVDGTGFDFAAAGPGTHPVTYTLTNQFGCTNQSSGFITIHEAPVANAGQNFHVNHCTSVSLNGSATSGAGPYDYMWSPSALLHDPTLPHPLTHSLASTTNFRLTVTDNNGCSDTDQMTVSVQNSADISIPQFDPLCASADPFDLHGGSPSGGLFFINDDTSPSTIFDPVTRGAGQHFIYYLLKDENDCYKTVEQEITVYPLPEINWTGQEYCAFSGLQKLSLALPHGGYYSGSFVSDNQFNTNASASGLFDVGYTYTDMRGCTSTVSADVTVHKLPDATAGPEQTIYLGNYTTLSAQNTDEGEFAYTWTPAVFIVSPLLQTTFTRELLFSQVFAVTVLDKQTGCSVKDETAVLVEGGELDFVYAFASRSTLCAGDTITLKTLVSGGKAPYRYYWYNINPQINFDAPHINTDTTNRDFVVIPEVTQPYYVKVEDSNGGVIYRQITPTVNPLPTLNFPLPDPFCYDTSIDLTQLTSPAGGTFFISDDEDNLSSPAYNPYPLINTSHLGQGTHTLVYKYTDANTCTSTISQTIEVIKITPSFSISQPDLCKPNQVLIENHSTGATSYLWDFEDNTNNTPEDIANNSFPHIFPYPDETRTYTIQLTALHPQCPAITSQSIEVEARPRALFSAPENGCAPHTLVVSNQSIGEGIQSYFWDFGDGTSSTVKDPVKTFHNASGSDISFPIRLTIASNDYQCQSTYEQLVTVYPQTEAGFSVYQQQNCSPSKVRIYDQSRNGQWVRWDFGDGNEYLGTGNNEPIEHTYTNSGNTADTLFLTQTVWINRHDQNLCTRTHQQELVIFPQSAAVISNGGKSLTEGDIIQGCSPFTVNLSSLQSPHASSRNWDLGDGNISSSASISHTFLNTTDGPVDYTVSLETLSPSGCNDNTYVTVRVLPPVKAGFTFTPPDQCGEATIHFINTSTAAGALTYQWSFSNGIQSSEANPTILFQNHDAEEKLFNIDLTATDQHGCIATSAASFRMSASPKAIITTTPPAAGTLTGCAPFTVNFSAINSLHAQAFFWDFDDGTTGSSSQQVVHTFTRPGSYQVSLRAGSKCQDYASITVEVTSAPRPEFATDLVAGCSPLTVNFNYLFTPNMQDEYLLDINGNGIFEAVEATALPSSHTFINKGAMPVSKTIRLRAVSPQGCTNEFSRTITIYPEVTAEITALDNNGQPFIPGTEICAPISLDFSAAGSINAASYLWDFGDGNTSTLPDPKYSFQNPTGDLPRTYPVKLQVFSQQGCTADRTFEVIAKPAPVADFMVDITEGCSPHAISIHNLSSNASVFSFDFGDGGNSAETNPSHLYEVAGAQTPQPFLITLEASHANGCTDMRTRQVLVYPELKAGFDISQTEGCNALVVDFTNTSIAPQEGVTWLWNFGNGNTSASPGMLPPQKYPGAGMYADTTYTVSLTLQNEAGCFDTFEKEIVVKAAPVARFTLPMSHVCPPFEMHPENLSQGAARYEWNFGDGSPIVNTEDKSIRHVFQNSGNQPRVMNITLTAIGENGCSNSFTHPITINPEIVARFEPESPSGCHPFTTTIQNLSQGAHHYRWDFGNGVTSSQPMPSYTFTNSSLTEPLERTIRLQAWSDHGCQAAEEQTITIYPAPTANVSVSAMQGCTPFTPSFSVHSENATHVLWDFGDGSSSGELNPNHSWINQDTLARNYNLSLSAFNSFGCKTQVSRTLTVYPEVVAAFTTSDNSMDACSPATLAFINQSQGGQTNHWNFGNGNTSGSTNPHQLFTNNTEVPAQYLVRLNTTSHYGCKASIEKEYTIYPGVLADFSVSPRIQTYPNTTIEITNHNPGMEWSYQWDLGNGQSIENSSPKFSYTYPWDPDDLSSREYNIRMEVSNGYCTQYTERSVIIYSPKPTPLFSSEVIGCAPFEVAFHNQSLYAHGYKWEFGDGVFSYLENPVHTYLDAGSYELRLIVMGDGGRDTLVRQIDVLEAPRANFEVKSRLIYAPADLLKVVNLSEAAVSWLWEFGDGGVSHDFEPSYRYLEPGLYDLSLTVFSDSNPQCSHTQLMENAVRVEEACLIQFPNAFRPSTSGSSDGRYIPGGSNYEVFYPVHHGVEEYQLDIFNRWGELIFRSNDPMIGWDGYVRGRLVEMGVYVWKVEVKCTTGKIISKAGDVTVIR